MRKLLRSSILVSLCLFLFSAQAQEKISEFTYDALGRLITVKDSVNGDRTYTYDAAGNRLNLTVASVSSSSTSSSTSSRTSTSSSINSNISTSTSSSTSTSFSTSSRTSTSTSFSTSTSTSSSTSSRTSTSSSTSSSSSSIGAPGTPSFTNITASTVKVSWTPSSTSGATYEYSYNGGVNGTWSTASGTSVDLSNLTPNSTYTFIVRAVVNSNGVWRSPESTANFTTLPFDVAPPGSVTISSITATTATATWVPSSTSGATYEYWTGGASWTSVSTATSVTLSSLSPASSYNVCVRAYAGGKYSTNSCKTFTTLTPTVIPPGGPVNFSYLTSRSVTAQWTPASSNATYEWTLDGWATVLSNPSLPSGNRADFSNLEPNRNYTFEVRAIAYGARSTPISGSFKTLTEPLVMVGSLTFGAPTASSVTVSWQAASGSPGADSYEYTLNGGASWVNVGNTLSATITGLTSNTTYSISVRARNASSVSSGGGSGSFTTAQTPLAMTGSLVIGTPTSSSVAISWQAAAGNPAASSYEYTLNNGSSWTSVGNTLSTTLTGLTPNTAYSVSVRARNANGASGGIGGSFTTAVIPLAMTGSLNVAVGSTSISVSWQDATGVPAVSSYEYTITGGASWINVGNTKSYNVTGLTPSTAYTISVRAKNANGVSGQISASVTTTSVPPAAPTGLTCNQNRGPGAWEGGWNPVANAHHYVFRLVDAYVSTGVSNYTQNEPNNAMRIYGTSTPVFSINTSTKPCKWVMACDANNVCGPQTNF